MKNQRILLSGSLVHSSVIVCSFLIWSRTQEMMLLTMVLLPLHRPIPINNQDNPPKTCPQTSLIWVILQLRLPSQVALSWQKTISRIVLRHCHYLSELIVWVQISKDRFKNMIMPVTKCVSYLCITVTTIPNKQLEGGKIYFGSWFWRALIRPVGKVQWNGLV